MNSRRRVGNEHRNKASMPYCSTTWDDQNLSRKKQRQNQGNLAPVAVDFLNLAEKNQMS